MICLSSSEPGGLCYIETASLDGETNLKIRRALPATNHVEDVAQLHATINCEQPNESLYTFKGNLTMDGTTIPITNEQILLRV
jgi:phospholipid-transporting ATPase